MRRTVIAGVLLLLLSSVAMPAPAGATWVQAKCADSWQPISFWKRVDSRAYASIAVEDGYEWNGGCWNDNDRDDTPTDEDTYSDGGEGPDCSGLTFKSWKLMPVEGTYGGRWYDKLMNIHGPYYSWEFHTPTGVTPFSTIPKGSVLYMDAYAKDGHIAMLYSVDTSKNTDMVIEAVGNPVQPPVGVFERDYEVQSVYRAVRRSGWTADCYPRCVGIGSAPPAVIVP